MKKLIAILLLVVLVVPGLAWAEEGRQPQRRQQRAAARGSEMELKQVGGKIVSLSANTVTIAPLEKSKDAKTAVVHISEKPELLGLLAKGLGRKAQLICRETDKDGLVLVKVNSIEGVAVPKQGSPWPGMRDKMQHGGKTLSPEQREKMRGQFKAMHERIDKNPELRKELRELAEKDPEAFRQRIRQIHASAGKSDKDGGLHSKHPDRPKSKRNMHGGKSFGQWNDPQIQKLRQEAHELAQKYGQAQGQEKEQLGQKLREKLSATFDKRVALQAKAAQELEKQLKELQQRLEERRKNREALIEKYFAKVTEQKDEVPE